MISSKTTITLLELRAYLDERELNKVIKDPQITSDSYNLNTSKVLNAEQQLLSDQKLFDLLKVLSDSISQYDSTAFTISTQINTDYVSVPDATSIQLSKSVLDLINQINDTYNINLIKFLSDNQNQTDGITNIDSIKGLLDTPVPLDYISLSTVRGLYTDTQISINSGTVSKFDYTDSNTYFLSESDYVGNVVSTITT